MQGCMRARVYDGVYERAYEGVCESEGARMNKG